MNKRIYLASPHMGGQEMKYVQDAFDTNWIAPLGPNVINFEKELCNYVNIENAVALSSGTAAIHLGLKVLGVEQGDIVFCSTLTFVATANPIMYQGATPVFIDSDYETLNMSPKALLKAFEDAKKNNKLPKAVIVVNLYGQSADYDEIIKICSKYNVPIIEDAAESLGAKYKGRYSGTLGDIGIYSFNGNKIITTSGGGMMIAHNKDYTEKALFWATQARDAARHYEHSELGFNYRMSNVVAGIGRGQLQILETRIQEKKNIYEAYKEAFKEIEDIDMMPVYEESNYWLSAAILKEGSKVKPVDIMVELEKHNIESRPVWKPMHLQPLFKECKYFSHLEESSVSEDLFNRGICLPSDTKMSEEDLNRVIDIIKSCFEAVKESVEVLC
ncbi:MAG: DegT/DnrJ/EryC1/StrS family aminotransferase [Paraclostridium sp.]